jgi:hypothetical protein
LLNPPACSSGISRLADHTLSLSLLNFSFPLRFSSNQPLKSAEIFFLLPPAAAASSCFPSPSSSIGCWSFGSSPYLVTCGVVH